MTFNSKYFAFKWNQEDKIALHLFMKHFIKSSGLYSIMLIMRAEGYGRGKIISPQQIKALSEDIPLTLLPRDDITKKV